MSADEFFSQPILNSPYDYPGRHWELDSQGQPTHNIVERRRPAEFIGTNPLLSDASEERLVGGFEGGTCEPRS